MRYSKSKRRLALRNLLHESITDGLETLGKDMSNVILFNICQKKGMTRDEILDHPEIFVSGLKEAFGEGSKVIERRMLESLRQKVKEKFSLYNDLTVLDYMEIFRQVEEPEGEVIDMV